MASVRVGTYLPERMFAALKQRLAAAADLAVEVSTLGEYGLGPEGFVELEEDLAPAPGEWSRPAIEPCPPATRCDQATPLRRSSPVSQHTGSGFLPSVELSSSTKRRNSGGSATRSSMRAKPRSSSLPLRRRRRHSV